MTWDQMAIDMLRAAKAMLESHPRSSASRAYYAAHLALAMALEARGFVPEVGRSTQRHNRQSKLIDQYLRDVGERTVRSLRQTFTRLYVRRIDADYVRRATMDQRTALESIRDASAVFVALGVKETQ